MKNENSTGIKYIPAKPWYVRLWRKFFPLKGLDYSEEWADKAQKEDKTQTFMIDNYTVHYHPDRTVEIHKGKNVSM